MLTTPTCLIPALRFNRYTTPWRKQKIENYANLLTGHGLIHKNELQADGKQECVFYTDLYREYGMITSKLVHRTNASLCNPIYSKYGDVLMPYAAMRTVQLLRATSLEKSHVLLGGNIIILRPYDDVNGSCLSLSVNTRKNQLIKFINGTLGQHIAPHDIKNIDVYMPESSDEQTLIALLFKRYETFSHYYEMRIRKLKKLEENLLNLIFPLEGDASPRIRFQGFSTDWEEYKFNELYGRTRVMNDGSYTIQQVISPLNMCYKTRENITLQQVKLIPEYIVWDWGDILFSGSTSSRYPFGRFVENTIGKGIVPEKFYTFKPLVAYDYQFWKYYINNPRIMNPVLGRVTNLAMIFIDLIVNDFLRAKIRVPSVVEQEKIGSLLTRLDDFIHSWERIGGKVHAIQIALLMRMFPHE